MIGWLPHVNASLNCLATILLLAGYVQIRRGNERAHRRLMISTLWASIAFLSCYLIYHTFGPQHRPLGPAAVGLVRTAYYVMLASHIILAALVPFLALRTIYLGLKDRRQQHRRLARWTFPIWLYVSITGVLVYVALYWVYPVEAG